MLDPMTSREQFDAEEMERYDEWAEDQHRAELEKHARELWDATVQTAKGIERTDLHRLKVLVEKAIRVSDRQTLEHEDEFQMDLLLTEWGPGRLIAYFGALAEVGR